MFKFTFKPEITAGQILVGLSAVGVVFGFWRDVSVDIALLKQGQLQQGETINAMRIDIREIRRDTRIARPSESPPAARGG